MSKKLKYFTEILIFTAIISNNLQQVYSLCNAYPKIFGEDTSDMIFNDMEINEATDTIVSGGGMKDATIFPTSDSYPILIVTSLSTTQVKWAVTDKT
jgi:hypothetical protein